jgi:hypothetical protein
MVSAPKDTAREEVVRTPAGVGVGVRPAVILVGSIDARRVVVRTRLYVDPFRVNGRGLVIVTLDDAFALNDRRRRRGRSVRVAIRIWAKVSRDRGSGQAQERERQ